MTVADVPAYGAVQATDIFKSWGGAGQVKVLQTSEEVAFPPGSWRWAWDPPGGPTLSSVSSVHPRFIPIRIAEGRTAENGLLFTLWEVLQQKAAGLS